MNHLRLILTTLFLCLFFITLPAQWEIGLSVGGTVSIPSVRQVPGQVPIDILRYIDADWKERWSVGIYNRWELSDAIRLQVDIQHRSPAFDVQGESIGVRGIYMPISLGIALEKKVYVHLGYAPHIHYRSYRRFDGDFISSRIDDPNIASAIISGLSYDFNERYTIEAHYLWGGEKIFEASLLTSSGQLTPLTTYFEVFQNEISLLLKIRLGVSEGE